MTADDPNLVDGDTGCNRYVVLLAAGDRLPQPIKEILVDRSEPDRAFETADHPLKAIALLSRLERERRLQARWELGEQTVLIVANRDSWGDLESLFDATREKMPSVDIWVCAERVAIQIYAGETSHDLAEIDDAMLAEDPSPPEQSLDEAILGRDRADDEDGAEERTTLTDEEMRELLDAFEDRDEDDPDRGGDRA